MREGRDEEGKRRSNGGRINAGIPSLVHYANTWLIQVEGRRRKRGASVKRSLKEKGKGKRLGMNWK